MDCHAGFSPLDRLHKPFSGFRHFFEIRTPRRIPIVSAESAVIIFAVANVSIENNNTLSSCPRWVFEGAAKKSKCIRKSILMTGKIASDSGILDRL